ncbi:hypothetical protein BDV26DRAFT_301196 [Aspergillus bertholletiae]|uniref:F-box domain-containing protein n=1 Tax=Aspergillus bertholletiae TaxID=1226010 RepID=A0A5N7ATS7_9EURO|nr:hypothetical protein BDV26DRAFT_301196 [Aspergillus bertholletiae]
MSNMSTDSESSTIQTDRHGSEVLRLFCAKYEASYKNGVESAVCDSASQTDIVEGRCPPTTVAPFLEILMGSKKGSYKGANSFDMWKAVNSHFGNSDTKLIFPFLALPYELRRIIYENYFELETTSASKKLINYIIPSCENRLSLMSTNRQIYSEARCFLYTNFAFGLKSVLRLQQFFDNLRPGTFQIIRELQIENVSSEHVNALAQLLSRGELLGIRSLKLVATPSYMGPASMRARVERSRKRLVYPVFKKRLRLAVDKLFYRSGFRALKPPTLILIDFRKDPAWDFGFSEFWAVSVTWKE